MTKGKAVMDLTYYAGLKGKMENVLTSIGDTEELCDISVLLHSKMRAIDAKISDLQKACFDNGDIPWDEIF